MGLIKIIPSNNAKPNETSELCNKIIKESGIDVKKVKREMSFSKNNNVSEEYTIVFNDCKDNEGHNEDTYF